MLSRVSGSRDAEGQVPRELQASLQQRRGTMSMTPKQVEDNASRIVAATHGDPFSFLGMHEDGASSMVVRAFLPGASRVRVTRAATNDIVGELSLVHREWLFAGRIDRSGGRFPYRLLVEANGTERSIDDPYSFPPILGEMDVYLITA